MSMTSILVLLVAVICVFLVVLLFQRTSKLAEARNDMSCSTSSPSPKFQHDVFISFGDKDTRASFKDELLQSLQKKGISLAERIEESRCAVVVFSREYASSRWCLDELMKIIDCSQTVLPVFYKVNPSDVRNQTGPLRKIFAKHEIHFKDEMDGVNNWKIALNKLADISGWDLNRRSKDEWLDAFCLQVYELMKDIFVTFRRSYDELREQEKAIFLDIACFFIGEDQYRLRKILEACGFLVVMGTSVLIDKSLITIEQNTLSMHDLVKQMGLQIVRQGYQQKPDKCSRLWHDEDIYNTLARKMIFLEVITRILRNYRKVITRILRNYDLCKGLPDFSLSSFLQKLPIPLAESIDLNYAANSGCTKPIVSASAEHSKLDSEFFKDQIGNGMTVAFNFPSIRNPGWIDHLHVGSTVMFKPPVDSDNSLAGFALYVGYETHEHGSDQFVKNEKSEEIICNFYTDKGLQHTFVVKNLKGSEAGQRGQFVCVPRKCFDGKLKEATFLEASVSTKPDMVVKRCRIHIISKQDTAKFAADLIETAGEYLLKDSKVCPNCKHVL